MKTLLVMAAGMGSRFGGIKQLAKVGPSDEILLDYSIYDAMRSGFDRVVFVIRKELSGEFHTHVSAKYHDKIQVEYVFQDMEDLPAGFERPQDRTKPWGTGHAVLSARHCIHEPFAVINADDFYGRHSFEVLGAWSPKPSSAEHLLVSYQLSDTISEFGSVSRGVCIVKNGHLSYIGEHTDVHYENGAIMAITPLGNSMEMLGHEPVSMNCWGFSPSIFTALERDFVAFLSNPANSLKKELFLPSVVE